MAEKVTVMVLKVDLQCHSCHKKIKKILCKIPQIRGQIYDVKQNTVTINVVCCSPEKIRDKLYYKGGKVIKSIEIKEPKKKPLPKDKLRSPTPEKQEVVVVENSVSPKEDVVTNVPNQQPLTSVKEPEPIPLCPPARTCCGPCSEGYDGGPCYHGHPSPSPTLKGPEPIPHCPPARTCCGPCSEGYDGGPCYHGYPGPSPSAKGPKPTPLRPPARTCCGPCSEGYGGGPCYNGYLGPLCYDSYYGYRYGHECSRGCGCGYGRGCHLRRCVCYIEENPAAECKIM